MVETYRQDLLSLIERVRPVKGLRGLIECKHFFGGAAGYVDGHIFVTLTSVGLALKLPEARRAVLLKLGATPLRYFPKAPIKKDYVVLPQRLARDDAALKPLFAESVHHCLGPRRANLPRRSLRSEFRMADSETLVFRASLAPKVYRGFEIADTSTLYALAQTIVRSFDFDFDHAFGFYGKLKGNIYDSPVKYELFVDMGESEGGARGVKRTRVLEAFPSVGAKMRFLFDYGDEWEFLVELVKRKPKEPKIKLPRLLISAGKAPPQYPDPEDE